MFKLFEQCNVRVYKNAKETGRTLGVGAFGSVVEVKIRGEGKFAGKKLHEVFIANADAPSLLRRECKLICELVHPNITRFYGVCKLPASTVPALVMELMDHSLEEIIESDTDHESSFPLETMISIFIDIANGLAYLHSRNPQVLHRDLTARNVLLDKSMNAKITDFGNSRIVDATRLGKTMTQTPGTQVYMPPEAFDVHSKYSDRLDTFSFGHLALYTIIREFPKNLLPATYPATDGTLLARSEVERRSCYMEKLHTKLPMADHHLCRLIQQCLHNHPTKRPTSTELLHWLQEIQRLKKGEDDFDEQYEEIRAHLPSSTREERRVATLRKIESDINGRSVGKESKGSSEYRKTGLIEKKSGGLKGRWRAYSFTLDYVKRTFKYTRPGAFAKNPKIQLEDISRIEELQSDGTRFPFKVHFVGKTAPWELNVYSEADRNEWKAALSQVDMECCKVYGQSPLESSSKQICDKTQRYTLPPVASKSKTDPFNPSKQSVPIRQRLESAPIPQCTESIPPPDNSTVPTAFTNDNSNEEDVYEEMREVLNPSQMDMMLQHMKQSTYTTEEASCNTSDYPPPEKQDKAVIVDEKLLITGNVSGIQEDRPIWAIAQQAAVPATIALEMLHKKVLSISEYSLSEITKIGEGKFGEVYKAQMQAIPVAVKVTKEYSSEKAIRDFQNEMSIMSEVAHHNIVRLYGIINEGPLSPALVMEYLPYGNLLTFLRAKRQPDVSLLKYMNDVAMGMHYLCEKGLIHRDLAARNILVDENETCKVSDFGLLREVPKDNSVYISTYQGPSPLRWMPPESISDKIFSPASDVWSYGILQWEMFNPEKKMPYHNLNDMQMVVKVSEGYRMPIPRGCPGLAAKIMRACWQHEPRNRPSFLLISNLLTQQLFIASVH